jgi:prepilin-type processing-associated H-X9-DG protein
LLVLATALIAVGQELPTVTPYRATSYQAVAKYLNPDGSFYLYMDSEQWAAKLDGFMGNVAEMVLTVAPEGQPRQQAGLAFHFLEAFLNDCGLRQLRGVGLSTVPESAEMYHNRMALVHATPGPPEGLYWECFTGENDGAFSVLDWVPQDAVLASQMPFHPVPAWNWLKRTIMGADYEPMAAGFTQGIMTLRGMGVDMDQWFETMGPNAVVVATVSRDEKVPFTLPNGRQLDIPQMALAVLIEVKDNTVFQFYDTILQAMPNVVRVDDGDLHLRSVPVPVRVPFKLLPTVGRMGPYLVYATNPDIVKAMDSCRRGERPSIRADEEFQTLAKGMPETGMAVSFLSRRFSETFQTIMQSAMAGNTGAGEVMVLMQKIQKQEASYGVSLRMPDGLIGVSRTNFDLGESLAVQAAVLPVALVGGIMLPALTQARNRAREVSDMNNLKQIGLAAHMYAADHNQQLPPDLGELWPYIGNNGRLFVSPAGQTPPPQDAEQVRAGQCDYLYFVADRKLPDIQNPSATPGVCTKPGLLKQGVNVLFCDGHVERRLVIDPALQALIDGAK